MANLDFENKPLNTGLSTDLPLVISLFVVQIVLSVIAVVLSATLGFISDSCTGRDCNYPLITASGYLILYGTVVVLLITVGLMFWLRSRGRRYWWSPIAGTGLEALLFFASWTLLAIGAHRGFGEF